jgi:hypothetical protein
MEKRIGNAPQKAQNSIKRRYLICNKPNVHVLEKLKMKDRSMKAATSAIFIYLFTCAAT